MSLGGLAIAIGLMVDGSVVVVENVFAKLGHHRSESRMNSVHDAVLEVGTPVIFGIGIIILVFLPLMTLEGMEGKMFAPLAYTIAIALGISLVLSLTLSPVLSSYLLKGGAGARHLARAMAEAALSVAAHLGAAQTEDHHRRGACSVRRGAIMLFPYLGTSFIPEMKEGTISPNMDRVPNISLDESIKMEMEAMQQRCASCPGVKYVVSRLGRGESPADPAGYNEADMMIQLEPLEERKGLTQDAIADEIRKVCQSIPGVNLVMAQPISDRVDEMVTGVRADVAVKIFGDDLDTLIEKANEVARVASGHSRYAAISRSIASAGQQYLNITIDRQAIARHGLNASDVHDVIEAAHRRQAPPPKSTKASGAFRPSCATRSRSATALPTSAASC